MLDRKTCIDPFKKAGVIWKIRMFNETYNSIQNKNIIKAKKEGKEKRKRNAAKYYNELNEYGTKTLPPSVPAATMQTKLNETIQLTLGIQQKFSRALTLSIRVPVPVN